MPSIPSQVTTMASFAQSISPLTANGATVTFAWIGSNGPMRASAAMDMPGYYVAGQANAVTNSRDFINAMLTAARPYNFAAWSGARTYADQYIAAINAYTDLLTAYATTAGGLTWSPPFPATIVQGWQRLCQAYIAAWGKMRSVAAALIQYAAGGTVNVTVPTQAIVTPQSQGVVPAATTVVTKVAALPPEAQAQIVGTQVAPSPTTNTPLPTASSPNASTLATNTIPAGSPMVAPVGPQTSTGIPIIHTPLYKEPAFYVALAAGGALLAMLYFRPWKA